MKKIVLLILTILITTLLFASNETDPQRQAMLLCDKYNKDFVSFKVVLDECTVANYEVACKKGDKEFIYKMSYDKIFGNWSKE